MVIDRIGRDKSYEMLSGYGLKVWDKISVSGTISEGEDIHQAYRELDKIIEVTHDETLTQIDLYRGTHTRTIPEQEQQNPIDLTIQGIIQDINACTVVDEKNGLGVQVGLVAYEQLATQYPLVQEAYLAKLQSLKNT